VGLPRGLINDCKAETTVINPIASGISTSTTDMSKQYLTNFLLIIQFAADSTHMEGLTRTSKDVTWIANRIVQLTPFQTANGATTTCVNILTPRGIVFSSLCDWNLIVTTGKHLHNE
jgi:hypothetical protein